MAAWEKNVPAPESPASRHHRDNEQMRGDWQGTTGTLANNLTVTGKLTYDSDGRYDRNFNHRGGEVYGNENGTWGYEADGRNSRIYVDRNTKLSAVNGKKSEIWDSPAVHKD
jgi:hypothetical protein